MNFSFKTYFKKLNYRIGNIHSVSFVTVEKFFCFFYFFFSYESPSDYDIIVKMTVIFQATPVKAFSKTTYFYFEVQNLNITELAAS